MCLAIPGRIIAIEDEGSLLRTGKVSFGGLVKATDLSFVPEAGIGDYVIVHAGYALSTIDEEEAGAVFDTIREIYPPDSNEEVDR